MRPHKQHKIFVGMDGNPVIGPSHWDQKDFEVFVRGGYRIGIHAGPRFQWMRWNQPEVIAELRKVQHRLEYAEKLRAKKAARPAAPASSMPDGRGGSLSLRAEA